MCMGGRFPIIGVMKAHAHIQIVDIESSDAMVRTSRRNVDSNNGHTT